ELTLEMAELYAALESALDPLRTGGDRQTGRTRRVNVEAELRAAGCTLTRAQFYHLVAFIGKALYPDWSPDELACHPQEGLQFCERIAELEGRSREVEADLHAALLTIPNMTHPEAPVGTTSEDNKVLRRVGEPPRFDFTPKDHVALAEALDLVDFEAGSS